MLETSSSFFPHSVSPQVLPTLYLIFFLESTSLFHHPNFAFLGDCMKLSNNSLSPRFSLSLIKPNGYFIFSLMSSNLHLPFLPFLHLFLSLKRCICFQFHWKKWRIYIKTMALHHSYPTIRTQHTYSAFLPIIIKFLRSCWKPDILNVCALDPVSSCLLEDISAAISPLSYLIDFSLSAQSFPSALT